MNNNDYLEPAPIASPVPIDETVIAADGYSTQEQPRHARGENPHVVHIDELPYVPAEVTELPAGEIVDRMQASMKEIFEGAHPDFQPGDHVLVRKDGSCQKLSGPVTVNPHTGTERHPLDIQSDPEGHLIVPSGKDLPAQRTPIEKSLQDMLGFSTAMATIKNHSHELQTGEAVIVKAGDPNDPTGGHLAGDATGLFQGATAQGGGLRHTLTIDGINRQQYGEDLSDNQLAFLRGEPVELEGEEKDDLEQRLAAHPPQFTLNDLPVEEEPDLPPLTDVQRADLMAGLDKINQGQATAEDIAKLRAMLGEMPRMRSLLTDLKRMQKQYPMIFGRHVHVKQRKSKTRKKKR